MDALNPLLATCTRWVFDLCLLSRLQSLPVLWGAGWKRACHPGCSCPQTSALCKHLPASSQCPEPLLALCSVRGDAGGQWGVHAMPGVGQIPLLSASLRTQRAFCNNITIQGLAASALSGMVAPLECVPSPVAQRGGARTAARNA